MARPAKVGGLRTTRESGGTEPEASALPDKKDGVYQFMSRNAAFRLSVRRRRVLRGPDNEPIEEAPRSSDGFDVPMDWALFEDNRFETPSKEFAEAIIAKAKTTGQYGVGREVWLLEDQIEAQDAALEAELRARIAAHPEIARRVLTPSEAEDFKLPPPVS